MAFVRLETLTTLVRRDEVYAVFHFGCLSLASGLTEVINSTIV